MSKVSLVTGTAVKTEAGYFYIKNSARVRIPNSKILKSWRFPKIVRSSEEALSHYPIIGVLPYRDGSLLWCISDAHYYLISGGKRIHVTDPQILKDHGLSFKDAFIVSRKERDLHSEARV